MVDVVNSTDKSLRPIPGGAPRRWVETRRHETRATILKWFEERLLEGRATRVMVTARVRRIVRLTVAGVAAFGAWYLLDLVAPAPIAAAAAFVLLAFTTALVERQAPAIARRIAGDAPLRAITTYDQAFYSDGWRVVLPGDLLYDQYPPENTPHVEARTHLLAHGAYDVDVSYLRLTLEGRSDRAVVVTQIRARVLHREAALAGTLVTSPSAGMHEVQRFHFDLDHDNPPARTEAGQLVFGDYVLTLTDGEVAVFLLVGEARQTACVWEVEVEFDIGGSHRMVAIAARGGPFRTTPSATAYTRRLHWAWYEVPARIRDESQLSE